MYGAVKNMKINYFKYFMIIGLILIVTSLIFNPFVIEKIYDKEKYKYEDNAFNKQNLKNHTIIINAFLISLGLFLISIKKINVNLALLIGTVFMFIILLEFLLSINPTIFLEPMHSSLLISKYTYYYDGIYEYDPELKMKFMKPNFKAKMFWGGYRWLHKTDKYGFRNPTDRDKVDIVLLGDSLIYGHGVNQDQTVAYFLENFTSYSVENLARTPDSSFQEIYMLNKYGLNFQPKYVLYFFFSNDLYDVANVLSKEQVMEFIETPIENITFKERAQIKRSKFKGFILSILSQRPYILGAYSLVKNDINQPSTKLDEQNGSSLEWNYTKKAILQMKYASDLANAEFIIIPITHENPSWNPEQFSTLYDFSSQNNISFIDISPVFNMSSYYLQNDGHYNEDGSKAVAAIVAKYLKTKDEY